MKANFVPTYGYPAWRRVVFVAALLVVAIVALAPSVSQGSVAIRVYGSSGYSLVSHVYVALSRVDLHEFGFPNGTGWVSITKGLMVVDLVSPIQQASQTVSWGRIHSGRYDAVAINFSNATVVMAGRSIPLAAPSPIKANVTLPVPPNGNGDVFFATSFDYAALFGNPPNLSLSVIQVSAV